MDKIIDGKFQARIVSDRGFTVIRVSRLGFTLNDFDPATAQPKGQGQYMSEFERTKAQELATRLSRSR